MALLEGRVVVVSGVGPNLGSAIAVAMADEGALVLGTARSDGALREVAAQVDARHGARAHDPRAAGASDDGGRRDKKHPGAFAYELCDITDPDDCARVVAACLDRYGRLDVLINNAHRATDFRSVVDADMDEWQRSVDTNLFGGVHMMRAAIEPLRRSPCASVININSMAMQLLRPGFGAYAVTKGGMAVLTRLLAEELGPEGIRVNGVHPGYIWCQSVEDDIAQMAAGQSRPAADVLAEITGQIALRRIPTADEVAGSVVFLASDLSKAVTGQALSVNGGHWMGAV